MPTARISLTVSSTKMPSLERNKKKKEEEEKELGEVLPWERYLGYWDTPHGRLARERRKAMSVADLHPEAVYQARRRHAAEQYAATTTRPGSMPQFASGPPISSRSEQSDFRRGARKFAEAHPEVVNHYAHCDGSCGNNAMRDAGRAFDRGWEGQNPPCFPRGYQHSALQHHISTALPHYNIPQGVRRGAEHGFRPFCDTCQTFPPAAARECGSYRVPVLMGMPGRDGLIHHESCIEVQDQPYCRCRDCEDRRFGRVGSPNGSYVRERAREWVREI